MGKRGRSSSTERSPKTRSVVAKRRTIRQPPLVKRLTLHPFLQDYADFYEHRLYYAVYNSANSFLFDILQPILQSLIRDLLKGVLMRWEENKPVGSLLPSCVEVRDHVAILPAVGSGLHEDKEYQKKFREAVEVLLGFSGTHEDRDDFFHLLQTPLQRKRFAALYFHRLLLNEAQRADFPVDTVENLRNRVVCYRGVCYSFEDGYNIWEKIEWRGQYNLAVTSQKNKWFRDAYNFRTYKDTGLDEAQLVRNTIRHLNDYRSVKSFYYTKPYIGAIVFETIPDIIPKLYSFMRSCNIDMDFKKILITPPEEGNPSDGVSRVLSQ